MKLQLGKVHWKQNSLRSTKIAYSKKYNSVMLCNAFLLKWWLYKCFAFASLMRSQVNSQSNLSFSKEEKREKMEVKCVSIDYLYWFWLASLCLLLTHSCTHFYFM